MEVRSYRDTPKRGETDAKWCAYVAGDHGHIINGSSTSGHDTEQEAREAAAAFVGRPDLAKEWIEKGYSNILGQEWIDHHLKVTNDLIEFGGKFYGDFSVSTDAPKPIEAEGRADG